MSMFCYKCTLPSLYLYISSKHTPVTIRNEQPINLKNIATFYLLGAVLVVILKVKFMHILFNNESLLHVYSV